MDPRHPTDEELLAGCQRAYSAQGYLVVACKNAHLVDERITLADPILNSSLWRILAPAGVEELLKQTTIAGFGAHRLAIEAAAAQPYFYRVEAIDRAAFERRVTIQ